MVCRKGFGDFFLKTKLVDEIFEIEKGNSDSYQNILNQLESQKVDYLISPHESMRTVLFCTKINAQHKVGFKKAWNFLVYPESVKRNLKLPDPLRQISLLAQYDQELKRRLLEFETQEAPYAPDSEGHLSPSTDWASLSLRNAILELPEVYEGLQKKFSLRGFSEGRAVLLFPGSVWATKRWTETGFVKVGQALQSQGFEVYIMGGPGEEALAEKICAEIPGAHSLAGKTKVIESAQLIARAALVIGNDSASTHLAAVCETPLLAIFGPTVLEFGYRPWSQRSYVVQKQGLSCRPCGKHGHHVCPLGTHECMKSISPEEVLQKVGFILRPHNSSH